MKADFSKIKGTLLKSAETFEESGALLLNHESKTVLSICYGFTERDGENKTPITEKSRYLMPLDCSGMLTLCILILADMKKLSLSDKISRFIPEFEHANKITLRQLLAGKSGIRDFYYGEILRKLHENEEYSSLSDIERRKYDMQLYLKDYSFKTVLKSLEGKTLEHEPGVSGDYSSSERFFLREIVERTSGMSLEKFAEKHIFMPLDMTETKTGMDKTALPLYTRYRNKENIPFNLENTDYRFFSTTVSDLEKLMLGIMNRKIFSEKQWKAATKLDKDNEGLGFSSFRGMLCFYMEFESFETATMCFDPENDFCYMRIKNCPGKYIEEGDSNYLSFSKDCCTEIEPLFTYPKNTKMVPYGAKNWRQASALEILPEQREFVCGAYETIAYAAAHKNHKLFVEMEGERAVGLLDLSVDKKKGDYTIEIVLIDKRYQGRGFGKIMLRFAVDYLKKAGAKRLSIGVNRFNIPAQRLYKSVGFIEDCVYEEGIFMTQNLVPED